MGEERGRGIRIGMGIEPATESILILATNHKTNKQTNKQTNSTVGLDEGGLELGHLLHGGVPLDAVLGDVSVHRHYLILIGFD
jgi:hypothetical protein